MKPDDPSWFALRVRPHRECRIADEITDNFGVSTYVPMCCIETDRGKYGRRPKLQRVALFTGILFVADLIGETWPELLTVKDVRCIYRSAGSDNPARVHDDIITSIRRREESDGGAIRLETANAQPSHIFRRGEKVRVMTGPSTGLHGLFQRGSKGRAIVLMQMLGAERRVKMPIDFLEAVASTAA